MPWIASMKREADCGRLFRCLRSRSLQRPCRCGTANTRRPWPGSGSTDRRPGRQIGPLRSSWPRFKRLGSFNAVHLWAEANVNYNSQNQEWLDLPALQWPPRRWSLLSVRAWTHGMGIGQVPHFSQVQEELENSMPSLPEIDSSIRGAQRFQLEQSNAALRREWDLQAQASKDAWVTGYRREYYQAWLPFRVAPPVASKDSKQKKPSTAPDPILLLCPSHLVFHMVESAASMLLLCPGRVTLRDSQETIEVQPGPCLTLLHGHIRIVAHILLDEPPAFPPKPFPVSCPSQVQTELLNACAFTHDYLGGDLYYWVPLLTPPQENLIQSY